MYRKYKYRSILPHLVGGNLTGNVNTPKLIPNMGSKTNNWILWQWTDDEKVGLLVLRKAPTIQREIPAGKYITLYELLTIQIKSVPKEVQRGSLQPYIKINIYNNCKSIHHVPNLQIKMDQDSTV